MNEPTTYTIDLAQIMRESLDDSDLAEFEELASYEGELAAIDTILAEQYEQEQ